MNKKQIITPPDADGMVSVLEISDYQAFTQAKPQKKIVVIGLFINRVAALVVYPDAIISDYDPRNLEVEKS